MNQKNDRTPQGLMSEDEVGFEKVVIGLFQAEAIVSLFCFVIVSFDVKAEAANVRAIFGESVDVIVEPFEDARAAEFFRDINALYPPEIAVAPIAPFISDEELSGDDPFVVPLDFSEIINAFSSVVEEGGDAFAGAVRVESALLGFPGHAQIEIGDGGGVGDSCCADGEGGGVQKSKS